MRLLALVEYDGTDFEGFQVQKRGRTIQGELERALRQITGEDIRVIGGGRTDSGVHALGQGVHFDTSWSRSLDRLQSALNAVLPKDVAIRSLVKVAGDFSARYDAKSRTYRYTILNQRARAPLARRYALLVGQPLDVQAMDAAARCLVGARDFGGFGSPPHGDNTVREMFRAQVQGEGVHVWVDLEANAFLYRMVRRIVGTLLWVGKHEMSIDEFREVLAKKRRAGQSVSPQGLCLVSVKYDITTQAP